jgi:PKD domain
MNYIQPINNNNLDQFTAREVPDANPLAENSFDSDATVGSSSSAWGYLEGLASQVKAQPASAGLVACVSAPKVCYKTGGSPKLPTDEGAVPATGYDYNSTERVPVTWKIKGIADCDGSIDGIVVTVNYGTVTTETAEDGTITATVTFDYKDEEGTPLKPNHLTLTVTGKSKDENNNSVDLLLYGPESINNPEQCYSSYPRLEDVVHMSPAEVETTKVADQYQTVTFSYRAEMITQCVDNIYVPVNPDDLTVNLQINGGDHFLEPQNGSYNYQTNFNEVGSPVILFKVTLTTPEGTFEQSQSVDLYVQNGSTTTDKPSVTIGDLSYAYHTGDVANNITCYSDDPNATFEWTVTCPGECTPGQITQTFNTATISPPFSFDLEGDYDFVCQVTAEDGITTNTEARSVGVYPISVDIPLLSIVAPHYAVVSTPVSISVAQPDSDYSYSFSFSDDNSSASGSNVSHSFNSIGTHSIVLTATLISDPSISFQLSQNITIGQ